MTEHEDRGSAAGADRGSAAGADRGSAAGADRGSAAGADRGSAAGEAVEARQAPAVAARFDGEPLLAPAGVSVAAALLADGRTAWRTTREGAQRGLFCGIGVCFDCLVEIDGESGQRACMIPLAEGMEIRSARRAEREAPAEPGR